MPVRPQVYTRQRPQPKCIQDVLEILNQLFSKGLQIPENWQKIFCTKWSSILTLPKLITRNLLPDPSTIERWHVSNPSSWTEGCVKPLFHYQLWVSKCHRDCCDSLRDADAWSWHTWYSHFASTACPQGRSNGCLNPFLQVTDEGCGRFH